MTGFPFNDIPGFRLKIIKDFIYSIKSISRVIYGYASLFLLKVLVSSSIFIYTVVMYGFVKI